MYVLGRLTYFNWLIYPGIKAEMEKGDFQESSSCPGGVA
jgi:hypothetical protein